MVQPGTLFEYLAAFVTIVLALAVSDLLISLHRLLRARHRVNWRPLPLLFALFVLLTLLTGFFELWALTEVERMSYYGLLFYVGLYFPLFLAACAVLPDDVPETGVDLGHFYQAEKSYVAALMILGLILDLIEETIRVWDRVIGSFGFYWQFYLPLTLACMACFGVIGWTRRLWLHWIAFFILLVIAHAGYSMWSIEGASAIGPSAPLP
jgi:hypothetical protein